VFYEYDRKDSLTKVIKRFKLDSIRESPEDHVNSHHMMITGEERFLLVCIWFKDYEFFYFDLNKWYSG
jgi:hypothetical protein